MILQENPSMGFFSRAFRLAVLVSTMVSYFWAILFSAIDTTSYLGAINIGAPAPGAKSLAFLGKSIVLTNRGKH